MNERSHDLGFAVVDIDREQRQGLPEIVYAPGKQAGDIVAIVTVLLRRCTGPVLVSRIEPAVASEVPARVGGGRYDRPARLCVWRTADEVPFEVAVVSAGTADAATAAEAASTARALGLRVAEYRDVGVAGLHRLLARAEQIDRADTVVVVAGMEGALASVVGGLVGVPVIAVPTSTGYGAALDGVTALLAMLSSCAAGITVVNIDNGLGAALAAYRLMHSQRRTLTR